MAAPRLALILRYLRPHRRVVLLGMAALVVVNLLSVTIPLLVRRVVDDLQDDLAKILQLWQLTRDELHRRTRAIWATGFRPAPDGADAVGSGFDTTDQDNV